MHSGKFKDKTKQLTGEFEKFNKKKLIDRI